MKSLFRFSLILVSLSSFLAIAQDVNQEEMMKQWQSYLTPGPEHNMLMNMLGEWEGDITMWMDPTQPPQKSTGTTKYESLMDGRYVAGHYSGMMMGMPFNGMDLTGYDNALKVFQNVWIDNMGTGMMITEGVFDAETNTITYKGKMVIPDGSKVDVRNIVTIIDKDHSKFEMFIDMGSGETKSMEINYKRKT